MKITKQQLSVILESVGIQNPYVESDECPVYPEKWVKKFKSQYKIDLNTDPAGEDNTAIIWASKNGYTELVKLLLADKRVNPSADDNFAIQLAIKDGHVEVVKLLLADKRVDPAVGDNVAIRMASNNGHTELVKLLLSDKRVDPSANDNQAIRLASEHGNTEVVKLLLADKRVVTADSFSISRLLESTEDAVTKKVLLLWAKDNRK